MRATKALLYGLVIVRVAAAICLGIAWNVRGVRAVPVKGWIRNAQGFGPARSPEDALDKFEIALEKRDYEAASQFLSGDYREWFEKGIDDAEPLAHEIDNLRSAMKKHGVKSDKGDFILFLLDPFPTGYKYRVTPGSGDSVVATLDWTDVIATHQGQTFQAVQDWKIDGRILHCLLPDVTDARAPLQVTVKKESDGHWRIQIPVASGTTYNNRHLRDTVDYLRKNGSNFENGLQGLENDVKNEPQTKEDFESALRTKLEQSK